MNQQSTALAPRPTSELTTVDVPMSRALDVIEKGGVTIFRAEVTIPVQHQYAIKTGRKQIDGKWTDTAKVGITSDGYDHMNRVVGVQFLIPEWIHDENGERRRNPIHRRDYIYERMVGLWYNDLGQMQAYSEDLEVDFLWMYQQARLNAVWYGPEPELTADGKPKVNDYGKPMLLQHRPEFKISRRDDGTAILNDDNTPKFELVMPDDEERKAYANLVDHRVTGLRYAQTVLKTRIMKVATGIRTLPIDKPRPVKVAVYGYRDNLTPEKRIEQASRDQQALFGKPLERGATLSDEEMQSLGHDAVDEALEEDIATGDPVGSSARRVGGDEPQEG